MFDPQKAYEDKKQSASIIDSTPLGNNNVSTIPSSSGTKSSGWDPQTAWEDKKNASTVKSSGWDPQTAWEDKKNASTVKSSGWDPQTAYEQKKTEPFDQTVSTGNLGLDVVKNATKYVIDRSQGKTIQPGVFDESAIGVGKIQGWCGEYASRLSTAKRVGDQWSGKISVVDHRDKAHAGDKLAIPLGVNKKGEGYGHMLVALTDEDASGNVVYAQSNGDGRQNKNPSNPGVGSLVVYNTKDLQKRYGQNFGFITGKLKINPFADKNQINKPAAAPQASQALQTQGGFQGIALDAAAKVGMGFVDRFRAPAKSDPLQQSIAGFYHVLDFYPVGSEKRAKIQGKIDELQGLVAKQSQMKPVVPVEQPKPPIGLNLSNPKALADFVLQNNINDLQNQDWWKTSPAKKEAWKIIQTKNPDSRTTAPKTYGTNEVLKPMDPTLSSVLLHSSSQENPAFNAIMDVLDPNSFLPGHSNQTESAKVARTNVAQNLKKLGVEMLQKPAIDIATNVASGLQDALEGGVKLGAALDGEKVAPMDIINKMTSVFVKEGNAAMGAGFFVQGSAINALPQTEKDRVMQVFNAPGTLVGGIAMQVGKLAGADVDSKEFNDQVIAPLQTLTNILLVAGGGKVAEDGGVGFKDFLTTKEVKVGRPEIFKAFQELNGAPDIKANPKVVEAMRKILNGAKDAVEQKAMISKSFKDGITIREARGYVKWFNKFFEKATPKDVGAEIAALITDGKKAASGEISPVEFVKKARDIVSPGESAALRDQLAVIDHQDPALYRQEPTTGTLPITQVSSQAAKLHEFQTNGAQVVVSVGDTQNPALQIKTYTYSDKRVGVSYSLNTGETNATVPMMGKYNSPREAVAAVLPEIQAAVNNDWGTASEEVRTEITNLQDSKLSEIPDKAEIMPWEDNYVPSSQPTNLSKLPKEELQTQIDSIVKDYVDVALKPTMSQGVTPGGIIRDQVTGEVVGRTGRVSNNPEWYQKAYKELGHAPGPTELKAIAIDHLMNGVKDHSIGELPPDENFRALMQAVQVAKPTKAPAITELRQPEVQGGGKTKVRGVARKIEATVTSNDLGESLGDLPTYQVSKVSEQLASAKDLYDKSPQKAKEIALGLRPAPKNILPESILATVRAEAIKNGDAILLHRIATQSTLVTEATTMGQRINMLKEGGTEDPIAAIQSISKAREQVAMSKLKELKGKSIEVVKVKTVKVIKEKIAKVSKQKVDWNSFISELKC